MQSDTHVITYIEAFISAFDSTALSKMAPFRPKMSISQHNTFYQI